VTLKNNTEQIFPRPLSGENVVDFPSYLVPQRSTLTGQFVDLEPQDAFKHADELYEAGHGSEDALNIWNYLANGPWPSAKAFTTTIRQQSASLDPIFYSIRSHATGKICGQASYLDIQAQNGSIEIGHIWFSPELQRTRDGTEALFLLLKNAMDNLGYRRMQWRCNSLNEKSRRAARRLGFRFEGIFYNHLIFKGKNRDTTWYSILDDEWPEVRQIIENWLDNNNFDADGSPQSSLTKMMENRSPSTRRRE